MLILRICLILMVPPSDVYQEYPPESWLRVKIYEHGIEYIWPNKAAENGKLGPFFKKSNSLLRHLLRNVVVANMDQRIKSREVALEEVKRNIRFKDLLSLMLKEEKTLEPVTLRNICQASLKYFRPHFSRIAEDQKDSFHRCIYPSLSQVPDDTRVLIDALGYSALTNMKKRAFKEVKQKWEAHIAQLYAKRKPQTQSDYYELLRAGRETFPPNEALENAIREEYLKLQQWLPFELQDGNN